MIEGQRLKEFLGIQKISQSEFSRKVGSSTSNVSNWINKHTLPNGEQIKQIMLAFPEFNIRWWFTGKGSMLNEGGDLTMTTGEDIVKYKNALAEQVIESQDLKNENRVMKKKIEDQLQVIDEVVKLLESLFTTEELKELKEKSEIDWEKLMKARSK